MSLTLHCAVLYLSLTSPTDYHPSEVNRIIFLSYPSRRHSCSLVNIPTPCITKIISHIEDVESKIQEHLKQFETSFEEWTSAMKDELEDVGVSTPEKEGRSEKARDEKCPELKKKMEILLAEAIYLIKSLETDRAEAEQALLQQKSRKKRISTKIDSWSLWKLQELPIAVQKEHESYFKDISELNIHLEDTFKTLRHLEQEKEKLEKANAKIQKDVDYMSQQGPLLELKRKVELDALRKCYSEKFELLSIQRKTECEGEIEALVQMKAQNHSYLKQLYKKAYKIGALYQAARDKTDAMEDQISEVRRKFKVREESLKKRTRAEISKGIEVQKELFSTEEYQFNEVQEFLKKKALYILALSEVEIPLRDIETELVRLKDVHQHHSDALEQIYERRLTVKRRVEATKKKLLRKRRHSRKELTKTEGRVSIIHQKIESNKIKTIVFNTKCKELEKQINLMEVEKNHFEDKLEKLKDEFIKLRFDREHVQAVQNILLEEKEMCQARVFEENKKFQKIFEMRQSTLNTIWKLQEESLEENMRLASEYQALQMMVLEEKDIYLNRYDRLLSLNDSVCVKKKNCLLHKKKDRDWETYLQMLIRYYKRKVANMQCNSQDSIQKILTVQHLKTAVQGYHMFCCSLKAGNRSKVQERLAGSFGPNRNIFPIKLLVNQADTFWCKRKDVEYSYWA
ncbi:coiled-coil domain-containing protein 178 [Psammomys obesus]|uniref:coiled-coil domain-containing protein 178 n=1 Tax=Psammomys obesus TaxID=48139 RepID=UPI0024531DC4|nr:coiled-coil domain-containing protein 178 [Psammomys obesus]